MKTRYRLVRRGLRGGAFYCVDTTTGKRTSLRTGIEEEARQIVEAKNQAERQPMLNLQIAKAYLAGTDNAVTKRTWKDALQAITESKTGTTRERWERVRGDKALMPLWPLVIIDTGAASLLRVLASGTVSTNVYLRRVHNFCVDMNWLPWPLIPKKRWPSIRFGEKRAITLTEHQLILAQERNPELNAFYSLLWHLGGAQSDVASLHAEDIDWETRTLAYARKKTGAFSLIHFGTEAAAILRALPSIGLLLPKVSRMHEKHRAKEFKRRCTQLAIEGVTLHSYRYAWAE